MAHHEPFKHLGPLSWQALSLATQVDTDSDSTQSEPSKRNLGELITTTFSNAQILIDSIPSEASPRKGEDKKTSRARSQTDSAVRSSQTKSIARGRASTDPSAADSSAAAAQAIADQLRPEWKEVKLSPKENPHGISVYKLPARDGRGAWFARRSLHAEVASFEKWRAGLRKEFYETSTVRSGDEVKSVRGLGAERKLEKVGVDGVGAAEVFLVSVQFPGPTTPRDFVPVIISPEDGPEEMEREKTGGRQFMLVSRPCDHPACPPRNGFIRGTYESVEMIREVSIPRLVRKTRSSVDLGSVETSRRQDAPSRTVSFAGSAPETPIPNDEEEEDIAIEWLMVTRSDPGGSVPRFMVEKGTPGGIVSDAGRFVSWLEAKSMDELMADADEGLGSQRLDKDGVDVKDHVDDQDTQDDMDEEESISGQPAPTGFYGMIAYALEAAGSVVLPHLPSLQMADIDTDTDTDLSDDYTSAEEGPDDVDKDDEENKSPSLPDLASSIRSVSSSSRTTPAASISLSPKAEQQHDKELRKLHEKQRRAHEKMIKSQERQAAKRSSHNDRDNLRNLEKEQEEALAKLREKHEREIAKQETKYEREIKRLADKREAERKKAEERARKAQEREERKNLRVELDKVKAERDVAVREMDMLREQVGLLQAQNTRLVARLGKEGISVD